MKTAIIHDWIIDLGGAENCLKEFNIILPDSDVFTLISKDDSLKKLGINPKNVKQSFIKKLPKAQKKYRNYLPFFPIAIEQFDLSDYDIVLSTSHAVAKGVMTNAKQLHITYCCTPIRYAWDMYFEYIKTANLNKGIKGKIAKIVLHYIRMWDYTTANRPDYYIAISNYIAKRIEKTYGKKADVIYPPVNINDFTLNEKKEDYYFTASRMVPYKRIPMIVEAFSKMPDKKLVVLGEGPDYDKVKKIATKNVEILGYQSFEVLKENMQKAKAFVFAAEEDFGIIPVEAQACGTPVIAYIKGGVRETVIESKTGIFFDKQTPESIIEAVNKFEKMENKINPHDCRKNAEKFSEERFRKEIREYIEMKRKEFFG